jgi:hypothetical protein
MATAPKKWQKTLIRPALLLPCELPPFAGKKSLSHHVFPLFAKGRIYQPPKMGGYRKTGEAGLEVRGGQTKRQARGPGYGRVVR